MFVRSSLDPETLTVELRASGTPEQRFRFRKAPAQRQALMTHLDALPLSEKQRERFTECGRNAWVQFSPAHQRYRVRSDSCKLRWCPACQASRGHHVRQHLRQFIAANPNQRLRLVTLTMLHSAAPLRTQLDNLRKAFRRLRQRVFRKERVVGGIGVIEIKRTEAGEWHPHLHIVAAGQYLSSGHLSKQWLSITKTSSIVDVRALKNPDSAIDYLCKYVTKPPPIDNLLELDVATDWIKGLKRSRLLIPFGNVPEYEPEQDSDDYPTDWEPVSSLTQLLERREAGEPQARAILHKLENLPDEPLFTEFPTPESSGVP